MTMQTPFKTSSLNALNAAANYPILTFCPASGQRVNNWRLMAPEGGYRTRNPEEKPLLDCYNTLYYVLLCFLKKYHIFSGLL